MIGGHFHPPLGPPSQRSKHIPHLAALRGRLVQKATPVRLGPDSITPARTSSRSRRVSNARDAQHASARYGWPLHVIDDAGHVVFAEQPEATLAAIRAALGAA